MDVGMRLQKSVCGERRASEVIRLFDFVLILVFSLTETKKKEAFFVHFHCMYKISRIGRSQFTGLLFLDVFLFLVS